MDNITVTLNRNCSEGITANVFKNDEIVELFRLREGHLALNWTDEKVKNYLINKLKNEGRL